MVKPQYFNILRKGIKDFSPSVSNAVSGARLPERGNRWDFSLRIQPVLLEDDGNFQCQVSASDGVPGIRTKTVQLTVYVPPEPPVIRPTELDSTAGLLTTIECTSRGGRPPPEILWVDERHPREPLGLGAVTTMELMPDNKRAVVTSKLSFTPRRTHDNATISCLTTHQALTSPLSSSVRLRIRYAPEVQVTVTPERLVEGDDAKLTCRALANPPKLAYRWYHNRMVVENQTTSTLMLHKISREMHQDSISCEVSNEVGTSKKTQSLHVRFGPVFKSLPQDSAAEMQNEVLLKCDVESNPPPSIVWLQEGSEKVIGTGPELRVVVGPSTTGSYRCVATVRERDLQFPDLVGRMRVLVKGPPTIVSAGEQLGRPGGTINLECNTVSVPSPIKVTWTYKGRAIDIDDPRYEVKEEQRDGGLKTILVIHDADQTDFGDYNCSVVNEYGVARKLIRLNEEKRVPLLLVMGGGGVLLFVIVVVTFLLVCNKKNPREKVHEKATLASETGAPNMYSAASDSRLTENIPNASGTLNRQQETALTAQPVEDSMMGKNNGIRDVTRVTRLRDDNTQDRESMFSQEALQEEESSGFLPLLDVARHDPSRRGSLTEVPAVSSGAYLGSTATQPTSLVGSELCTLRRHNNGPDLTQPYHNGSLMRNNTDNCRPHERYSNYPSYAASPPPPPPYPRPTLSTKSAPPPPQRPQVTSPLPSQQGTDGATENISQCNVGGVDSNYIFSSEAMMKPGTLV
ncbi:Immunoglobulin-like domain [Trinorchestia longiramus]|nr:Immunoglobulin-like domain [Trinorchestia longiramus]